MGSRGQVDGGEEAMRERTSSPEVGLKELRGWRLWGQEAGRGAVRGVAEEEREDAISSLMASTLDEKNKAKSVAVSDDGSGGGEGRRRELKVAKRRRGLDDWEEMRDLKKDCLARERAEL